MLGRLQSVSQSTGLAVEQTVYAHDKSGSKSSQTDAEGRVTKWAYDAENRLIGRTLPEGQSEAFSYDATGLLIGKTSFTGDVTRFGYTATGLPNVVTRPDGTTIASTYTATGMLETSTVSGGTSVQNGKTSYRYDAGDRLVRQQNPDGSFIAYAYDPNGNVSERSTKAGTLRYEYDAGDRLSKVTGMDGKAASYVYDANGKLETAVAPNGVRANYRHNARGQLELVLHTRADGKIVTGTGYTLKPNGQRELVAEFDSESVVAANAVSNPVRSTRFKYDDVGRVLTDEVSRRGGDVVATTDYAYDKVGNRSTKTTVTAAGTEVTAYVYDKNDRLTLETRTPSAGGAITTAYTWDAKGNLKSKTTGSLGTYYVWTNMHKILRIGMGKAFETAICRRWPGFVLNKKFKILGKMPGELFLTWKPCDNLELVFSIHPNSKPYWSSFGIDFTWSRTGDFHFFPSRGTLRSSPPEYDIRRALRRGLRMEKADISMTELWLGDWGVKENRSRRTFKSFDNKYDYPYFPLKSPLATFDPATQWPEDYQRLQAAENAMTVDDAVAMATPIIEEICDYIALLIWPFVEDELIPYACSTPYVAEPAPE